MEVLDQQAPLVSGCPQSRTVFLEPGEVSSDRQGVTAGLGVQVARAVSWTEPTFTDNVKIEHVMTR